MKLISDIQELLNADQLKEALDLLLEKSGNTTIELRNKLVQIIGLNNNLVQFEGDDDHEYLNKKNKVKSSILELCIDIEKELQAKNQLKDKELQDLVKAHRSIIDRIKVLIHINKKTIWRYTTLSVVIVAIGLIVILVVNTQGQIPEESPLRIILTVAGGLVSTISGFPIKIINEKYNAISLWREFKNSLQAIDGNEEILNHKDEIERLRGIIWEKTEKLLLT